MPPVKCEGTLKTQPTFHRMALSLLCCDFATTQISNLYDLQRLSTAFQCPRFASTQAPRRTHYLLLEPITPPWELPMTLLPPTPMGTPLPTAFWCACPSALLTASPITTPSALLITLPPSI